MKHGFGKLFEQEIEEKGKQCMLNEKDRFIIILMNNRE